MNGYQPFSFKFGRIAAIPTAGLYPIWDGASAYDGWPAAPAVVAVASSSADDQVAGGGATHVIVTGQDGSGAEQIEEIAIGTSGASLFSVVYSVRVSQGEDLAYATPNHGLISMTCGGKTVAIIVINAGRTQMAYYRIPTATQDGRTVLNGELKAFRVYPDARTFKIELLSRNSPTVPWNNLGTYESSLNDLDEDFVLPRPFAAGADIMAVISNANGGNCSAFFELELKLAT